MGVELQAVEEDLHLEVVGVEAGLHQEVEVVGEELHLVEEGVGAGLHQERVEVGVRLLQNL